LLREDDVTARRGKLAAMLSGTASVDGALLADLLSIGEARRDCSIATQQKERIFDVLLGGLDARAARQPLLIPSGSIAAPPINPRASPQRCQALMH
jgi:hypothetical protein